MQEIILNRYPLPDIRTDAEEESFQSAEYEKMFGADDVVETKTGSYTTVPADNVVVFQLMVTNRLLGILVALVLFTVICRICTRIGRFVTNKIFRYS